MATNEPHTTIRRGAEPLTLINVFTVHADRQAELVQLLIDATEAEMRHQPGFISASIHRGHEGTRVVNYAQWRSREDFDAMLQNPRAREHMGRAARIAAFDPILCEVAHVDHA